MLQQYLRTWAEISLDAIEHNVAAARQLLAPGTKLCCVIKADGYGHGAAALARFLDDKCEYYAVAILEEGLALRRAGVTKPILLLGYTSPNQHETALAMDLTLTIFSWEQAQALSRAAAKTQKIAKAHIAVDTGMGRVGFADDDKSVATIAAIARLPFVAPEGLFTHFARADETDKTSARAQYHRYKTFAAKLAAAGIEFPLRHVCNSAALMEFDGIAPGHCANGMARFGISLYGLYPSEEVDKALLPLAPAMCWKTHVVHLKTVPPGTGISYGHTFVTARETRVATLPVGYADGYPRALSNRGHVILRGQFAPILGRVCMDQLMVDVTDILGVAQEEEVILLGRQGDCAISMEEIGAMSASFNYETACRVGQRVPRVYVYHDKVVDFHSVLPSTFHVPF
ncbi:MAG: alanine racemase [Oscillospiraceae bacterium]|jgi:alanine racemase|nr:alanine racemase [Oscillospiraceae bacterium]